MRYSRRFERFVNPDYPAHEFAYGWGGELYVKYRISAKVVGGDGTVEIKVVAELFEGTKESDDKRDLARRTEFGPDLVPPESTLPRVTDEKTGTMMPRPVLGRVFVQDKDIPDDQAVLNVSMTNWWNSV